MTSSTLLRQKTWVILPSYNEATYIERVLKKVSALTPNIIVVDDGSKDETVTLARKHVEHVLVHRVNLGKGAALKTGSDYAFQRCGAHAVVFMDSDDQHDSQELGLFFEQLASGHDVVFGVREIKRMPFLKRIGNVFASVCVWILFGKYIPDIPSGYKAVTSKAYEKLRWWARGYQVELEIAARVAKYKLPYVMIPIKTIYHDHDKGMTLLDVFQMLWHLISWRVTL